MSNVREKVNAKILKEVEEKHENCLEYWVKNADSILTNLNYIQKKVNSLSSMSTQEFRESKFYTGGKYSD